MRRRVSRSRNLVRLNYIYRIGRGCSEDSANRNGPLKVNSEAFTWSISGEQTLGELDAIRLLTNTAWVITPLPPPPNKQVPLLFYQFCHTGCNSPAYKNMRNMVRVTSMISGALYKKSYNNMILKAYRPEEKAFGLKRQNLAVSRSRVNQRNGR